MSVRSPSLTDIPVRSSSANNLSSPRLMIKSKSQEQMLKRVEKAKEEATKKVETEESAENGKLKDLIELKIKKLEEGEARIFTDIDGLMIGVNLHTSSRKDESSSN